MSQLQIKTNIENNDLPKDFEEKPKLGPISFCDLPFTLSVMSVLDKFTELLKGDKKD